MEDTKKANELTNGNTNKICINFEIDVPHNIDESIFNSIILGIHEYKQSTKIVYPSYEEKTKIQNNILIKIQQEIEQLIESK